MAYIRQTKHLFSITLDD